MPVHVCTIAARNYLPFVRTLATSFREVHPDGRMTALIIDDTTGEVDAAAEPFELLRLEDLGTDVAELHRMAMLYDVTEFSTSLKPWLLQALLDTGSPSVLYLDPDIQVFAPLDELAELAVARGIVLTPHTTAPFPLDGKMADDRMILAAGIYNLGFIGVSPGADPFLAFWRERLSRECTIDPMGMRFVDQRWVDFAPGCYDVAIVRDTSYNVAYWNLHGRTFRWGRDSFEVDGRPLAFFHFSGYSPNVPHLLSRHQVDRPRILLSEHPDLARLCDGYGTQLATHGWGVDNLVPYGLATMADGTPVDQFIRHIYRSWVDEAEGRAPDRVRCDANGGLPVLPPDPFNPHEVDQVIARLNRPPEVEGDPGRLSVYFATLYGLSPDLHPAFPDPQGSDRERFLAWAADEVAAGRLAKSLLVDVGGGEHDGPLLRAGIPTASSLAGTWAPPDALHPGIVVAGYLNAELGIGEGARLTTRVVEATGLPFTTVGFRQTPSRQDNPFEVVGDARQDLDVNIVVVNADQVAHFAGEAGPAFFAGRYTIGQWAWELETFPEAFLPALDLVDEVWAVSTFTRDAIVAVTTKPVFAFPHPIVEPAPSDHVDRATLGLPDDRFAFLFCFDLFSITERKNPIGLITAFTQAFVPDEGPVLVVKVINGDRQVPELERIKWAARDRPDIVVLDHYLDAGENAALMASADCYVSLHRSEGFGLTMAEAMALGKPVIATAYSGNLDFMDRDTAYLVPWSPGAVPPGCSPYPEGARWAEPDLAAAATLMRHVFRHPEEAAAKGRLARDRVLATHGIAQRATFVRSRFAEIQAIRERQVQGVSSGVRVPLTSSLPSAWERLRRTTTHQVTRAMEIPSRRFTRLSTALDTSANLATRVKMDDELDTLVRKQSEHISNIESALSLLGSDLHNHVTLNTVRNIEVTEKIVNLTAILNQNRFDAGPFTVDEINQTISGLRAIPYMSSPIYSVKNAETNAPEIGFDTGKPHDGYAGFEDIFRGEESFIKEVLLEYVDELSDHTPVLDIGCGRGEMMELLTESGVCVTGVDIDPEMVEHCLAKGFDVTEDNALAYLGKQSDESMGAVFSAQMIEHLSYQELLGMLSESLRVLVPGGLFIAETVNPHAVHAFKTFWTDLTHRVPIFPEVLLAHCRDVGFSKARVRFPGGSGVLERDRWSCGQYAVLAWKDMKPL